MNDFANLQTREEQELEKKNRITSGSVTAAISIAVLILFFFYPLVWESPKQPEEEKAEIQIAVEPDYGGGGGGGAPKTIEPAPVQHSQSAPQSTEQTPDPDAVKVKKTPDQPVQNPTPKDNTLEELMKNRNKAKNNPTKTNTDDGEGTGQGSGQGSGKGTGKGSGEGSGEGSSTGPGIGMGHTFGKGRAFKAGSTNQDCHEAGKVVLDVQLLPSGKIVFQDVDPRTTGSDCLIKLAKDILKGSSFNASADPASDGSITFIFKVH